MEGQKKSRSSTSSSFTSDLFGSSESQRSSSSAGIFASMFPPPGSAEGSKQQDWGSKKGYPGMGQQEKAQPPCHLSSSLYYGGQDIYSSTTNSTRQRSTKDKEDGDPNGNNSQGASRGNWWQGSLYY